jgi:hypothetical protein
LEPIHLSGGREEKCARSAGQEGIDDAAFEASNTPNGIATLCPPSDNVSKADNILKTKSRKRHFSPTKAENMLKRKPFTKNYRNP